MQFRIRDARTEDVPALAALHVQTFTETHRGGRPGGPSIELREQQWGAALAAPGAGSFCLIVERDDGELVGFANGSPHDGSVPGFDGRLNKIYLLRAVQRQGLGRLLLRAVAQQFLDRSVTSMLLFGDASNPSNGFHEAFGVERLHGERGQFNGYGWRDLPRLIARCDNR